MSKTLPAGLQAHLDTGVTTMAQCWRITRKDDGWSAIDPNFLGMTYLTDPGSGGSGNFLAAALDWVTTNTEVPAVTSTSFDTATPVGNSIVVKTFKVEDYNISTTDIDAGDVTLDMSVLQTWIDAGPSLRTQIFALPDNVGVPDFASPISTLIDESDSTSISVHTATSSDSAVLPATTRWLQVKFTVIDNATISDVDLSFLVGGMGAATIQGFTEHDLDLTFDGTTFLAASGFTASQIQSELGLNVDNLNVDGALSAATLNEDDLASGFYDGALVELFLVNFEDVSQHILLLQGTIGEVKRFKTEFSAEIRSLTHKLQQKTGRTFQRYCDAAVGDARCGVNLTSASFSDSGTVAAVTVNRKITYSGLTNSADEFYTLGKITFLDGLNQFQVFEIKGHADGILELWTPPPYDIAISDTFTLTAGCKKDTGACKDKFSNLLNFRGYPFIPGNDYINLVAVTGGADQDGNSIFA